MNDGTVRTTSPSSLSSTATQEKKNGPNVIILSGAGKPIFSRYGKEEELSNVCGCIQALMASTSLIDSSPQEDGSNSTIEYIQAGSLKVVFMNVGALTLVAVSDEEDDGGTTNEAFLRMLLEYVYSQIVFTLTIEVQRIFERSQNFDLRGMLGASDGVIRSILDRANEDQSAGQFLTSGIETVYPLSPKIRDEASRILVSCLPPKQTLFALLLTTTANGVLKKSTCRVVTLAQPKYERYRLHGSDLHLILNFVESQPSLWKTEAWFPMCLPRFNSSGFVYAYTCRLYPDVINSEDDALPFQLNLMLIGADNNLFEAFQKSAFAIQSRLGVLNTDPTTTFPLVQALTDATSPQTQESLYRKYCNIASALHFVFRCDIIPQSSSSASTTSSSTASTNNYSDMMDHRPRPRPRSLPHCFTPPLGFPFLTPRSQRRVWDTYQRLALRLRLGTSSFLSTVSRPPPPSSEDADVLSEEICTITSRFETPPSVHGVAYLLKDTELFMGLNGTLFELYAILPGTFSPTKGAALCARLVRRLIHDESILFLTDPPLLKI